MTRDKFNELYTGIALIINDQTPANATLLTPDEMRDIKAMWHKVQIGAWYEPPHLVIVGWKKTYYSFSIPIIHVYWVSVYRWGLINIGYWSASIRWKTVTIGISIPVFRYVPGKWHPIYVPVPDVNYKYNEDRVIPTLKTGVTVGGMVAGVIIATIVSGGTFELAIGVAAVVPGVVSLGLDALTGDLQKLWTDPWLRVSVEGQQIYPYPSW